jgi:hypothetical protein
MTTLAELIGQTFQSEGATKTASVKQPAQNQPVGDEDLMKIAQDLGLYSTLFPEDELNKVASQATPEEMEKVAYQDALGSRTASYFNDRLDSRLVKIANEVLMGSDMVAAQDNLVNNQPPTQFMNNSDGNQAPLLPVGLGSTPYANNLIAGAEHGAEGSVGHYEQQKVAHLVDLATQKYLLIAQAQANR